MSLPTATGVVVLSMKFIISLGLELVLDFKAENASLTACRHDSGTFLVGGDSLADGSDIKLCGGVTSSRGAAVSSIEVQSTNTHLPSSFTFVSSTMPPCLIVGPSLFVRDDRFKRTLAAKTSANYDQP
jgi:hypothetical protein